MHNILIAGIGGTGVVTASGLLGLAAHLEGKHVVQLDQTGLAQKYGAVLSHVRISTDRSRLHGMRIPAGQVDLLLGADLVVAAGREPLSMLSAEALGRDRQRARGAAAELHPRPRLRVPGQEDARRAAHGEPRERRRDARRDPARFRLLGDSIGANVLMLGFAFQRGQLPVSGAALYRALELYGRNVEENKLAFDWGRFAAESPEQVERLATAREDDEQPSKTPAEAIARREAFLVQYQNRAYADRYRKLVDRVAAAEQRVRPGSQELVDAVARNYFALLAYKDEYEVARLHTETDFLASLRRNFGADARPTFHFSPPLFAGTDPATGRPKKYELGPWVLPVLRAIAKLKFLRGTKLDPFGYGEDRRLERALILRYERLVERIVAELDDRRYELALELARGPKAVRGYGPIKRRPRRARPSASSGCWRPGARRRSAPRFRRARARPSYRRLTHRLRRGRAADAAIGERLCDEPRHRNRLAAVAADPVRFVLDLIQRLGDLADLCCGPRCRARRRPRHFRAPAPALASPRSGRR